MVWTTDEFLFDVAIISNTIMLFERQLYIKLLCTIASIF